MITCFHLIFGWDLVLTCTQHTLAFVRDLVMFPCTSSHYDVCTIFPCTSSHYDVCTIFPCIYSPSHVHRDVCTMFQGIYSPSHFHHDVCTMFQGIYSPSMEQVRMKENNKVYAMKLLSKFEMVRESIVEHTQ